MKNKLIVATLLLISGSSAFAEMSCGDLFTIQKARPSEEQINTAIYDLKYLLIEQYSKHSTIAAFAKAESQNKLIELRQYLSESEIKERIRKIEVSSKDQTFVTDSNLKNEVDKVIQKITKRMAIKNIEREHNGNNIHVVLNAAAAENNTRLIEIIIGLGVNINKKNIIENTALYFSVIHGHKEAAEILIKNGANIKTNKYQGGLTILQVAKLFRKYEIVELLEQAGATE